MVDDNRGTVASGESRAGGGLLIIADGTSSERRNYPIKMTPLQRKSLLDHANLSPGLTWKIERTLEGTQTVEFTRDELDVLYAEIGETIASVRSPHKARLTSVSRKIEALFEQEYEEAFGVTPAEDP
jgi:hypothetical protein